MNAPRWIKDHIPHRKNNDSKESSCSSIFNAIKERAEHGKNAVSNTISQSIETVSSVSSEATQSIKNHIESGVEAVSEGVKNVAEGVKSVADKVKVQHEANAHETEQSESQSSVPQADSQEDSQRDPQSDTQARPREHNEADAHSSCSSILNVIKEKAEHGKNAVSNTISQSIETVSSVSSEATQSIKNHIESGVEAVSEGVKNVAEGVKSVTDKVKAQHEAKTHESEQSGVQSSGKKPSFIERIKQSMPHRTKRKPLAKGLYIPAFSVPKSHWYSRPLVLTGIAFAILVLTQTYIKLYETFSHSPILGLIYLTAFLMLCFAAFVAVQKERRASQSMVRCLECRTSNNAQEVLHLLKSLPCNKAQDIRPVASEWYEATSQSSDVAVVKSEYSRLILEQFVDRGVAKIISSTGIQTAGLVVISPFAIADMLIVMITSLSMMNKIAQCYGISMNTKTRYRMYKTVLLNMSISGVAELTTDVVSQFGAGMTGMLSARAGQAILAGRYIAKLGIQMAIECRPVPFTDNNKLSYGAIIKSITSSVRNKANTSENIQEADKQAEGQKNDSQSNPIEQTSAQN